MIVTDVKEYLYFAPVIRMETSITKDSRQLYQCFFFFKSYPKLQLQKKRNFYKAESYAKPANNIVQ